MRTVPAVTLRPIQYMVWNTLSPDTKKNRGQVSWCVCRGLRGAWLLAGEGGWGAGGVVGQVVTAVEAVEVEMMAAFGPLVGLFGQDNVD